MAEKVRLASIGLGWWGDVLADKVSQIDTAEIVSCFARTEETRKAFAEKHDCRAAGSLDEVLKDPEVDGILAATPHSNHVEIIAQAASAGKHVFIEKPFTLTVENSRKAITEADKAGVVLQVGHHRRRHGANRRIREMIEKDELGVLHQLEATFNVPKPSRTSWRGTLEEAPLGGLTGLGVHMIDTLHYFAGPIKRIFCFSKQVVARDKLDDVTAALVEFENGPLGYIAFSHLVPKVCTVNAFGTEALAWSEEDGARVFFQKMGEIARTELEVEAGDAVADELDEFARSIQGKATPETGGPEALAVVEVMVAMIESVKTGKPVDIVDVR